GGEEVVIEMLLEGLYARETRRASLAIPLQSAKRLPSAEVSMPPTKSAARSFTAPLQRMSSSFGWTTVRIPFNAAKLWAKRGHIRVRGTINGFEFRSNLFPDGQGNHYMTVNKKVQCGAGVRVGMKARFCMEPDTAPRPVTKSGELERVLRQ